MLYTNNNEISFMKYYTMLAGAIAIILFSCTKDNPAPNSPAPNAAFTYTSARVFPVQIQFINTSTPGGVAYFWDFGDGTTVSSLSNPVHIYTQPAVYQIRLVEAYANGTKDTAIKMLKLDSNGPSGISSKVNNVATADFTFNIPVAYAVTFANKSTNANSYLWSFGDGTNSTSDSAVIKHNYYGNGPFNIILKATGDGGTDTCSAKISF
jgi:large repetitive protein